MILKIKDYSENCLEYIYFNNCVINVNLTFKFYDKHVFMEQKFQPKEHSHTGLNILKGEHVLVSPHRSKRPWQGKVRDIIPDISFLYYQKCDLYPTINALMAAYINTVPK
jgi:hypothetical protein